MLEVFLGIQVPLSPSSLPWVDILRLRTCFLIQVAFLTMLLVRLPVYGQSKPFQELEDSVYRFNNALKFKESQALLLPVLQSNQFSAEDKYQAAILLSYTYKRVQDYESTLQFLEKARQWARQTPQAALYLANILAQEAFAHFDIHNYEKADSLMSALEKTGFQHIDLENKSKLVMQQGYLLFMAKQYPQAEATYDKAIGWMRASSPCDLPMIYVKKLELYNAMQRPDQMRGAFRESGRYADSCGVIKYHIYAHEQLLRIYKSQNDPEAAGIAHRLDSLNLLYAQTQHLAGLHNQKEAMLLAESGQELQREQSRRTYLTFGLVGVGLLALVLLGWVALYRHKKRRLEVEFLRMKAELEAYLAQQKHAPPTDAILLPVVDPIRAPQAASVLLSARQQQVLTGLAEGLSNRQIADQLFVSENTVKYHIRNIYQILEIKDRKDLFFNFKK